jgi:hypothetical protein
MLDTVVISAEIPDKAAHYNFSRGRDLIGLDWIWIWSKRKKILDPARITAFWVSYS